LLLARPIQRNRLSTLGLSKRDAAILELMLHKLEGSEPDFEDAASALHESVVELIPAGRTYVLGVTDRGPILGSVISGVGIATIAETIALVRVDRDGRKNLLGSLW
jgi:hypothetical protein